MEHFDLYTSGICQARFDREAGWLCSLLERETAAFSPAAPLTAEQDALLEELAHFSPLRALEQLDSYTAAFAGLPASAEAAGGRYTQGETGHYQQQDKKFPLNVWVKDGQVAAFLCPSLASVSILVRRGYETQTPLALWQAENARPLYGVRTLPAQWAVMRDGVKLCADVYLPAGQEGPFPCVLVRTPYDRGRGAAQYQRFVRRGYAVAVQDVRGRGDSEGEWIPHRNEIEDGADTLAWAAAQPWCDGRIGTFGGSYLGYVQWCAAAAGSPHLKAMISLVTAGSSFVDLPRRGGAWCSGSMAWNFSVSERHFAPEKMQRDDWDQVLDIRPLHDLDRQALGRPIPFWQEMLRHPDEDMFWQAGDWKRRFLGPPVPVLIQSGWFDDNGMGTTEALDLSAGWPHRKVVLGPWQHSGNSTYHLHAMDFPEQALRYDVDLLHLRWLDRFVRGMENDCEAGPAVEYYDTGANRWLTDGQWPPADSHPRFLAIAAGGTLTTSVSPTAGADHYCYDPENPAVQLIDVSENELAVPADYAAEEQRPDVLVYSTPELKQPVTLAGDALVRLYIEADVPDTDFIVRICDAAPDGSSIRLADGVLRARYREGFDCGRWMDGRPVRLDIRTSKLCHTFAAGHRIRLTVTSSAKNLLFPHPNTRAAEMDTRCRPAHITLRYGGVHPGGVWLPVLN